MSRRLHTHTRSHRADASESISIGSQRTRSRGTQVLAAMATVSSNIGRQRELYNGDKRASSRSTRSAFTRCLFYCEGSAFKCGPICSGNEPNWGSEITSARSLTKDALVRTHRVRALPVAKRNGLSTRASRARERVDDG